MYVYEFLINYDYTPKSAYVYMKHRPINIIKL